MLVDAVCHHPEGWGPVSRLRLFDLTSCFEEAVLFSVPLGSLILLGLLRSWHLSRLSALQRTHRINTWLLWAKLVRSLWHVLSSHRAEVFGYGAYLVTQVVLGLILSTGIVDLGIAIALPRYVSFFPSFILEAIAFLVLPLLTYLNHTRTRRSSTIALIFWLAYIPSLLIWTRTTLDLSGPRGPLVPTLRWGIGALGVVAFALESLGPEFRAEPDDKPRLNPESPQLTANIFSLWTFGWLTSLMSKGAKQFITEDDLPELIPEDETSKLGQKLQRAVKKQ